MEGEGGEEEELGGPSTMPVDSAFAGSTMRMKGSGAGRMVAVAVESSTVGGRWKTTGRPRRAGSHGRKAGESCEGSSSTTRLLLEAAEVGSERGREGGTATWLDEEKSPRRGRRRDWMEVVGEERECGKVIESDWTIRAQRSLSREEDGRGFLPSMTLFVP